MPRNDLPMKQSSTARRLLVIAILGVGAISISLAVRQSRWATERRLKSLSLEELALATRDSPRDAQAFLYYGFALLASGDAPGGENAFRRAAQLNPSLAKAQLGLGNALISQGKLRSAIDAFTTAAKLDNSNPDAHMGLAHAYDMAGSPYRAIEPLQRVLALRPQNAGAWYALGRMYGSSHQWDRAYEALKQAVKYDPNNSECWREAAQASLRCNRLKDAEQQATQAIKLKPSDPVSHFILGRVYSTMGDDPMIRGRAQVCFQAASARDPNMPQAYFELGQLYNRSGNLPMAEANYRKAVALDPSDDQALYQLGLCLVKRGNTAEGNRTIKGAQELASVRREMSDLINRGVAEPRNRELRLRLARICRKYGDYEGAAQAYSEFQRLGDPVPAVEKEISDFMAEAASAASASSKEPNRPANSGSAVAGINSRSKP
jgi:tetratricopeptide (TPR) repeat protein